MYKLARQVRFSINPFLDSDVEGFNSYTSKPSGEGLAVFFELCVKLAGEVEPTTGFVVNVNDIDRQVREAVVPIFGERIRENFRQSKHIGFSQIAVLLELAWNRLANKFDSIKLDELSLKLNPFRKITVGGKDCEMIFFSEKFEFAAMHKLWNDEFTQQRNIEVFGKCANPAGHGHNYIIEVTVKTANDRGGFSIAEFEKTVDDKFIKLVDHKNLNADVAEFRRKNPTVENIAVFAWEKLTGRFGRAMLHCVTIWETDRMYCSYYG